MKPHEPEWLELADAGMLQKVYFLYIDWPTGPVHLHSYIGDIEIDGQVWNGVGVIGAIEGNGAAKVSQKPVLTFKLSDVPDRAAGFMTATGARGRELELHVGVKNPARESLELVGGIKPEFYGRTDRVDMNFQEVDQQGVRRFDYIIEASIGRSPRLPLTYYHSDSDQRRRTADDPRGPDLSFRYIAAAFSEPTVWTPT